MHAHCHAIPVYKESRKDPLDVQSYRGIFKVLESVLLDRLAGFLTLS